jgi:hypothetical protein
MRPKFVIFLLFNFYFINAQNYIRLSEANKHIGETVRVAGRIFDTRLSNSSMNNSATTLTIGNDCPDQTLVIAISEHVRTTMNYKPEDSLAGKRIWATGKLENFAGKTQLAIVGVNDIKVVNNDYNRIFTKAEQPPTYPGGTSRWLSFPNENLDKTVARKDGASAGKQAVRIQFMVDTEGNISDVQAIEVPKKCAGCGPEAVRVVRKSGRWIPAIQNCQKVTFKAIESIYFD